MKKLIILSGIPGSGKSSIINRIKNSDEIDYYIISKDKIRFSILDSKNSKIYFSNEIEETVSEIGNEMLELAILSNWSIIIDETNVSVKGRLKIIDMVIGKDYSIEIHQFSNFEKAKKQNRNRKRVVPLSVMERKIFYYESFSLFEKALRINQQIEIVCIRYF